MDKGATLPDAVVLGSGSNDVVVYRTVGIQDGVPVFAPPQTYFVGTAPASIASACRGIIKSVNVAAKGVEPGQYLKASVTITNAGTLPATIAMQVQHLETTDGNGDAVVVSYDGASVRGAANVRAAVPAGSVFLEVGTVEDSANALTNGEPRLVEVRRP